MLVAACFQCGRPGTIKPGLGAGRAGPGDQVPVAQVGRVLPLHSLRQEAVRPMNILLEVAKEASAWSHALSTRLPEAAIHQGPGAPACDFAVVWRPDPEAFQGQARLKAIFSLGAGVDGLLSIPSLPRHVPLVRMEDVGMAEQMAEYALYVALRHLRRMPKYERDQLHGHWDPQAIRSRASLRVGVLGLGVLGGRIAQSLAGFGFTVSGWSRGAKDLPDVRCLHGADTLEQVFDSSEVLFIALPLTPATFNLLDEDKLFRLHAGSTLCNVSRGGVLSEAALIGALDAGVIAEAFLDVFMTEPLPGDHPFWRRTDIRITPHVAALTPPDAAAEQVVLKIRSMLAGQPVSGVVSREHGY